MFQWFLEKIPKIFKKNELKNLHQTQNDNIDEIEDQEIKAEFEKLKYKMGKYLHNLETERLTFKLIVKRYWLRVIMLFIAATVFNAGVQIFLSRADTIPSGVTGVPFLIQNAFPVTKPYFALLYLACNVPLFIIFGLRIKKSFVLLSLTFMVFQIGTNLVFTEKHVLEFFWKNINLTDNYGSYTGWSKIIYTFIGGALIGIGIAISRKAGGSTGGTDIIGYYFSTKAKKSVGSVLSIIGFVTAAIFIVIFEFIKPNYLLDKPLDLDHIKSLSENDFIKLHDYKGIAFNEYDKIEHRYNLLMENYKDSRIYFGVREVGTILYVFIINIMINLIYPKYKKISMTIVCQDPEKVLTYFKLIKYWHSYRIEKYKSGYTGQNGYKITTIMLLLEAKNIIDDLKQIDPRVWISVEKVSKVVGQFSTFYVE
ncbi:YitT family protein [Mycoplasmopsis cynos]|uniref:YitT family protein n=2 Tax=Mycoplasmopsis cynos TaxID=171284 RepID=UPI0025411D05|nr:YitT family protein [Mycoplasmopsis cynos]MCU9934964.1 YitT family protein [Mycoplasmopsis cynos]